MKEDYLPPSFGLCLKEEVWSGSGWPVGAQTALQGAETTDGQLRLFGRYQPTLHFFGLM